MSHLVHIALLEADALTVLEINGRDQKHDEANTAVQR
jgi:hypothetical protein